MNIKEWLLFVYGIIFATSTPYLKPRKRFLFPTATWKFDGEAFGSALTLFLGGSGICAHLRADDGTVFMVNTNLDEAARQWRDDLRSFGGYAGASVALSSLNGAFGTPESLAALGQPARVFVSREPLAEGSHDELGALPVVVVVQEMRVQVGGESVLLIPVRGAATGSDLVVFFEKRSVMMFGALFVNRIHPWLFHGVAGRASQWIDALEELMARFQPRVCVPAEGDVGDMDDVREFVRYLRALTDPAVEFSYCRKNFDWMEIPSATSLEENFDLLRRNVKTHASIN